MKQEFLRIASRWVLISCLLLSPQVKAQFAKGADIGWLSEMEASNRKFYDNSGKQQDLLDILKSKGINSIRLRVWVNPTGGWCGKADVLSQALRAKEKGFRIMIDFHYSDSWADPGQQTKPTAWAGYNFTQLKQAVYDHTYDVLNTLKTNGINPEWVQVGNETNNGMLWEDGRASVSMKNFADLVLSGYNAVKAVNSSIKVIVHISNGWDNGLFRWMFDGLKNNGAKWDVIGMSLYPDQSAVATNWQTTNAQCLTNMKDMVSRYGKEIMIAEIGMPWSDAQASFDFITDILKKTRELANSKGLGVFYWEPGCYNGWRGYQKGAFDNSGKPTKAMDAFLEGNVTSVEEEKAVDSGIDPYPNPFVSQMVVQAEGEFAYTLYDMGGNVREQGFGSRKVEMGRSLPAGLYVLKIIADGTEKLVKVSKKE